MFCANIVWSVALDAHNFFSREIGVFFQKVVVPKLWWQPKVSYKFSGGAEDPGAQFFFSRIAPKEGCLFWTVLSTDAESKKKKRKKLVEGRETIKSGMP
jgi:hypothetical protein